jgi:hypothetical protein
LVQEAQLDGGSTDFFAVLSVVFDYAFEKNCAIESSDGINDLTYLVKGGLVESLTLVYKALSRQMIVDGQKVDRSLAALCKTCLSVFEEIPSGQRLLKESTCFMSMPCEIVWCAARVPFSSKCLSIIYSEWFVPGLKQPHPTTVYNIMEVSVYSPAHALWIQRCRGKTSSEPISSNELRPPSFSGNNFALEG